MFSSQKTLVLSIKKKRHVLIYPAWQQTFWWLLWRLANVIVANLMQHNLTRFKIWNALLHHCCRRQFSYCQANEKEKGEFCFKFYWEVLIARLLKISLVK